MGRPSRVPSNTSVPLLPYPSISGPISMRPTRFTPGGKLCTGQWLVKESCALLFRDSWHSQV